jgi:hypothetical protein
VGMLGVACIYSCSSVWVAGYCHGGDPSRPGRTLYVVATQVNLVVEFWERIGGQLMTELIGEHANVDTSPFTAVRGLWSAAAQAALDRLAYRRSPIRIR